ncbi:MAG: DUF4238 domain-containing protein [Candidatus Saccharimonadales bacterium]
MGSNVMQHTLTKVILERFVCDGKVQVVIKKTGAVHESSPKTEARVKNFLTAYKDLVETVFHEIEGGLTPLFGAIDTERHLSTDEQYTAKMAVVLHLLRSVRTKKRFDAVAQEEFTKAAESLKKAPPEFIEAFRSEHGYDPGEEDMAELAITADAITNEYIQKVKKNGTFDRFIGEMYEKFKDFMEDTEVEIGIACGSETLVLPDVGALIRDHKADKNGFSHDVSLTTADIIMLTIGPRHVISIVRGKYKGKRPEYTNLSDEVVKKINRLMIDDAEVKYYRMS